MNPRETPEKLKEVISKRNTSILYEPLRNEVYYRNNNFPLDVYEKQIILPSNKKSDPFFWAKKCKNELSKFDPYILIPGTMFDLCGTRHGKGGGWYDRFLSSVPANWLRVGIAYKEQISKTKLKRKEWDQAVDWVIINNGYSWDSYEAE